MRTFLESAASPDDFVDAKEVPRVIETEILDADGLVQIVYGSRGSPHPRFRSPDRGGAFKLFHPEYLLDKSLSKDAIFCVSKEDGVIVGIGKLLKHERIDNAYYITSVSVDPEYAGRGYARKILEGFFRLAKERNYTLVSPGYTDEGLQRLKRIDKELAQKYGVRWVSDEKYATTSPDEWSKD